MFERYDKHSGRTHFIPERGDYVQTTPPPHYEDIMDLSKATAADLQTQLNAAVAMLVEITGQSREYVHQAIAKRRK